MKIHSFLLASFLAAAPLLSPQLSSAADNPRTGDILAHFRRPVTLRPLSDNGRAWGRMILSSNSLALGAADGPMILRYRGIYRAQSDDMSDLDGASIYQVVNADRFYQANDDRKLHLKSEDMQKLIAAGGSPLMFHGEVRLVTIKHSHTREAPRNARNVLTMCWIGVADMKDFKDHATSGEGCEHYLWPN
ncbi:MAG: hypothetical protein KGI75_21235 [Rhizobiaceae bacterium]|nr:hypothetical protein [Rhizobiaceae bacterium]